MVVTRVLPTPQPKRVSFSAVGGVTRATGTPQEGFTSGPFQGAVRAWKFAIA